MERSQRTTRSWAAPAGVVIALFSAAWNVYFVLNERSAIGVPAALLLAPIAVGLCLLGASTRPGLAGLGLLIAFPCCVVTGLFLLVLFFFAAP